LTLSMGYNVVECKTSRVSWRGCILLQSMAFGYFDPTGGLRDAQIMDTAAMGRTQKQDDE